MSNGNRLWGKRGTPEQRLLNRRTITEDGCWVYTNRWGEHNYKTAKKHRPYIAIMETPDSPKVRIIISRLAYQLWKGEIPEGLDVCHTCDNGWCYNPEHLFLGTPTENIQDSIDKGRFPVGEKSLKHKLTEKEVIEILDLLARGMGAVEISKYTCVTESAIRMIRDGKRWKHLPRPPELLQIIRYRKCHDCGEMIDMELKSPYAHKFSRLLCKECSLINKRKINLAYYHANKTKLLMQKRERQHRKETL